MSNRRFEMDQYRQILVRMRQGDSDRAITRTGLIGRHKAAALRQRALQHDWLDPGKALPADTILSKVLEAQRDEGDEHATRSHSSVEPYRETVVTAWYAQGIQATTIHQALQRDYGFQGSYCAVLRFVNTLAALSPRNVSSAMTLSS